MAKFGSSLMRKNYNEAHWYMGINFALGIYSMYNKQTFSEVA